MGCAPSKPKRTVQTEEKTGKIQETEKEENSKTKNDFADKSDSAQQIESSHPAELDVCPKNGEITETSGKMSSSAIKTMVILGSNREGDGW